MFEVIFLIGFLFSIIAGVSMSLQGVFNTRVSEKIGTWQTNVFVQGTALIIALLALLNVKSTPFREIKNVNKLYLTGGILAVVITFTVMEGIKRIGITTAISTILVSQLISASLIDCFGLFNTDCCKFGISKILGVIIMVAGILLFRLKS